MYGDELELEGKSETSPALEAFSRRDYLARQGIHGLVRRPQIELLSCGGGSPVRRGLLAFRAEAEATIGRIPPEPEGSLLTGILLGVEARVPEGVMDAFPDTGTTHAIAMIRSSHPTSSCR
jgi:predicted membrane metal-binding protein